MVIQEKAIIFNLNMFVKVFWDTFSIVKICLILEYYSGIETPKRLVYKWENAVSKKRKLHRAQFTG